MKKHILLLTLLLSVVASAFAVEAEIDGLWYELVSKTKEATVIQYKNNVKYSGDIVIPETVEYNGADYSVTSIGNNAFYECVHLTSATIPNSVTSIGEYALYNCSGLTTLAIGSGVKTIYQKAFAKCTELADMYCYAEKVPSIKLSEWLDYSCTDAFEGSYIEYATLHVPEVSIDDCRAVEPWKNFKTIVGFDGTVPEILKCATPTIAFMDGKLKFSSETEDVEYVSEVAVSDAKKNYSSEVSLTGLYKVSVYATKAGYDNSDVATLEFTLGPGSEVCDVNKDGAVDVADIATIIDKMAGKE